MAYRAAILHQDYVGPGVVTANSAQPNLPPSYLQDAEHLGLVWQTVEGNSTASIFVDFGAQVPIGVIALLAYGGGPGANFFIRESTTDPTCVVADARSTGLIIGEFDPTFRHFIWVDPFGNTLARYLRIDVDEAGASHIAAGGLLAGPLWKPEVSYEQGFTLSYEDDDVMSVTRAGVRYVSERASRRRFQGNFPAIGPDEYTAQLVPLGTRVKRRKPIVFVLDYESDALSRDTIVGFLANVPTYPQAFISRFAWPVDVMEIV